MSIDAATVAKLANLSRLEFNDTDAAKIGLDLGSIFTFISKLQEVNTEGVMPMTSVLDLEGTSVATRERADVVTEPNLRDKFQAIAPQSEMGFYVVPQVIE
ncbi:MAG: Asp-tRNA(Asn)/Glu-tRNA(Gln) amidotransferase subunit GatC [Alphaproteobacteria bacterium]